MAAVDWILKRGDTRPPLTAQLVDDNGAIDLTSLTSVKLLMKLGQTVVSAPVTVVDALTGRVQCTWLPAHTNTAGVYNAEFEITWSDGGIETIPNDSYFTIEIFQDLG
jgi:hypothetical protein